MNACVGITVAMVMLLKDFWTSLFPSVFWFVADNFMLRILGLMGYL
jgi:hypothetical protein